MRAPHDREGCGSTRRVGCLDRSRGIYYDRRRSDRAVVGDAYRIDQQNPAGLADTYRPCALSYSSICTHESSGVSHSMTGRDGRYVSTTPMAPLRHYLVAEPVNRQERRG